MTQAAKFLGTVINTTQLTRVGIGIGVVHGVFILGVTINSSLKG